MDDFPTHVTIDLSKHPVLAAALRLAWLARERDRRALVEFREQHLTGMATVRPSHNPLPQHEPPEASPERASVEEVARDLLETGAAVALRNGAVRVSGPPLHLAGAQVGHAPCHGGDPIY